MPSLLDHGPIRTVAVERVVAPIASHMCHLVLLCDSDADPECFSQLEEAALTVAEATEGLAAAAARAVSATEDDVLRVEMSSLLESVAVSGQHVLLAAQKLGLQPSVTEHREELISATQNVFLGVVKVEYNLCFSPRVLLVEDDAAIRRITAAADRVLESLSELGSSADMESLLKYFQVFSQALLLLNSLTLERAHSLQDPRQTDLLLDSLVTLKRCISMLHTATCTTIKHPTSEQAQEAKRFIVDKVQSAVGDIVLTLRSERPTGSMGVCGCYTDKRNSVLQLLATSCTSTIQKSSFDSLVRDVVFHCMAVANSARRHCQQTLVGHCRFILHLWSDMKKVLSLDAPEDNSERDFQKYCSLLAEQIELLDGTLMTALVYHVLDTFTRASSTVWEILNAAGQFSVEHFSEKVDLSCVQSMVEDLISDIDQINEAAQFVSAVALEAKSLENVENSKTCLKRLRAQMEPLSLELAEGSPEILRKLCDFCNILEEETSQLQDAVSDVVDVREFTSLAINEMVDDRRGCDEAFREQNYHLLKEHAARLVSHMKLVTRSVRRVLDKSHDPIYRNGLLVLLKQAQSTRSKVAGSVRDMLIGSTINVNVYTPFSDNVAEAIKHFKVLRRGLDGQQHPHLLSPLRQGARRAEIPHICLPSASTPELNADQTGPLASGSLVFEAEESYAWTEREEEERLSDDDTVEAELACICDSDDLSLPAVSTEHWPTNKSLQFDLLPLLYEVVTVTKGKDVTALNRACAGILELSNCYAQSAKEALAVVDAIDAQTLEDFRAELVSLTPLLVHTAQETAMSSVMSTESLYKHSVQLSDLISNTRKVLLPAAGNWYHAVYTELEPSLPTKAASVRLKLNEVVALYTDTVQLLTSSDVTSQNQAQETFGSLHNKLNKAQNHTRCLLEFSASDEGRSDHLEGLCILWGLSIQVLLKSLDMILGTSSAINQLSPQKQLMTLSENSLRIQEATRLTILNCRSAYKSKQLRAYQDELKTLTDSYLKAAEELDNIPKVLPLAKVEFLMRQLMIKIRVLLVHLSKANKNFDAALQSLVAMARSPQCPDENLEAREEGFEKAAESLLESVKLAIGKAEDSLNYFRDPRARSNLRSINDHLSFQTLDITSRARLMVETRCVCDTLSVDVLVQCWSAKAHYVAEEIRKQDGIHQQVKEQIEAGLQGQTIGVTEESSEFKASDVDVQRGPVENVGAGGQNVGAATRVKKEHGVKDTSARYGALKEASSLTSTSLFLKKESDSWDPQNNRIVEVTRRMADTIFYMTQYLKKRGPIPDKEAFVTAAKDVITGCQSVTHFIRVIANHCLDTQCAVELSLVVEQILTITNQLSIISSVNAVTPGCKSSDEILVKNAQNLLQTVLRGVHAAETACITGLKQPDPNSDDAKATALCFQWRRNLEIHRAQQSSNTDTDELGLRKTSFNPVPAPSLVPPGVTLLKR